MLVNWAVGEDAPVYLPGMAKKIPAGSTLIFQVHYTTNGTAGRDRSRLGLIFAKEPPAQEIRTAAIANPLFAIPGGASHHQVEAEATFSEDVKVWTMHPHMHLRGKDMTYTATYPDGRQEIVLRVPRFDFGWQTDYWLAQPLALPKGSKLHVAAHFDNSAANKANPDPTATVRWGDQTWEEMMIGFFTYTVEGQQRSGAGDSRRSRGFEPLIPRVAAERIHLRVDVHRIQERRVLVVGPFELAHRLGAVAECLPEHAQVERVDVLRPPQVLELVEDLPRLGGPAHLRQTRALERAQPRQVR